MESDNALVPIMNCRTKEDANLAIAGLERRDVASRTRPDLTPTYMSQEGFKRKLFDFLRSRDGANLLSDLKASFCPGPSSASGP